MKGKNKKTSSKGLKKQRPVHEESAGGIVFKRTKNGVVFALMKDSFGKWAFPKGHIEKGEEIAETAARETLEELGLDELLLVEFLGKIEIWFRDRFVNKGALVHKDIHFFLFETPEDAVLTPQVDEFISEAKWVSITKLLKMSSYKDMEQIVKRAIRYVKNEVINKNI
jgi:8-oxo-dGTP pyrophosphatase MutT (NUDIX family)